MFGTNTSAMNSGTELASIYTHELIIILILVSNSQNWLNYRLLSGHFQVAIRRDKNRGTKGPETATFFFF